MAGSWVNDVQPYLRIHGYCGCFGVGGWVSLGEMMTKKTYDANLLSEVIGDVLTYRDMGPKENETWESWYYSAFDLLIESIHETFERNQIKHK